MESRYPKTAILYHKFFVYLPAFLVLSLIKMIYVSYWVNYLFYLLVDYNQKEIDLKNFFNYPFLISSSPYSSFTKGIILAIFSSMFLVLLLISLIRTIFSDPGNFPDPRHMEFKIVLKNLLNENKNKAESSNTERVNPDTYTLDQIENGLNIATKSNPINIHNPTNKNNNVYNLIKNKNPRFPTNDKENDYYNASDSMDIFKNEALNLFQFTSKMDEYPICSEEFIKRTQFIKRWYYSSNLGLSKLNEAENISSNSIKTLNNSQDIDLLHSKKGKEKSINAEKVDLKTKNPESLSNENSTLASVFNKKKDETNNLSNYINYDNNYSMENINNATALKVDNKLFVGKEIFKNYKDSSMEILEMLNDEKFDSFLDYDIYKAYLCNTCLRVKVERSHHCKQCGKCILKMDHHCPWLANCIGYSNYKFFLLTHFHGIVSCLIVIFTYWETFLNASLDYDTNIIFISWYLFVYITTLALLAFLVWLFYVNWVLMFKGLTVIENAERERFPNAKIDNPYGLGIYKNFTTVFGTNPLIWLLPIMPNDKYGGLTFEKNEI